MGESLAFNIPMSIHGLALEVRNGDLMDLYDLSGYTQSQVVALCNDAFGTPILHLTRCARPSQSEAERTAGKSIRRSCQSTSKGHSATSASKRTVVLLAAYSARVLSNISTTRTRMSRLCMCFHM